MKHHDWERWEESLLEATPESGDLAASDEWLRHRRLAVALAGLPDAERTQRSTRQIAGLLAARKPSQRQRVVTEVRRRIDHRQRRASLVAWAAVLLVGAFSGAAIWWQLRPAQGESWVVLSGTGAANRAGRSVTLRPADHLASGDQVRAIDGDLVLAWPGETTRITLSAMTQATFPARAASGQRIVLTAGVLRAEVAPQPIDRPLLCVTPQAEAMVIGTRFTLATSAEKTSLSVDEGHVRLITSVGMCEVVAGEYALATLGAIPTVQSQTIAAATRQVVSPPLLPVVTAKPPGLRLHFTAERGIDETAGWVSSWRDQVNGHQAVAQGQGRPRVDPTAFFGHPALCFDGQATEMILSETGLLNDVSSGTCAVWVQCEDPSVPRFQTMFSADDGINQHPFEIGYDRDAFKIWTASEPVAMDKTESPDGPATWYTASANHSSGWHHLAYCADGTDLRMYIDGFQVTHSQQGMALKSAPFFAYAAAPSAAYRIGATAFGEHIQGKIAEIVIWNRALTESEMRQQAIPPTSINTIAP